MDAFDRISARTPEETRRLVSKMLDVADRIHTILKQKGMSQKDLAVALHKSESEISKWVSGTHNLELKTIIRIEEALGEDILTVPKPQAMAYCCMSRFVISDACTYYGKLQTNPIRSATPTLCSPQPTGLETSRHRSSTGLDARLG